MLTKGTWIASAEETWCTVANRCSIFTPAKPEGCFKAVSELFQGCFNTVSRPFQNCFKAASRTFTGCSRLFQYCFKVVSRLFQRCFQASSVRDAAITCFYRRVQQVHVDECETPPSDAVTTASPEEQCERIRPERPDSSWKNTLAHLMAVS